MLGRKVKSFKEHLALSLEDLVPPNHFYRQLEAKLDLSFVRDLVKDAYDGSMGRPSIDPIVFFKLQLIMFFEGIRSERQLMELVNVNLAQRWYLGYDLDEPVPDHSSLSKIRARYGLSVFQQFFESIVERCVQAGLVWGKELYFDGTKVRANAAVESLVPRWYWKAKQHVQELFASDESDDSAGGSDSTNPKPSPSASPKREWLVDKYDGQRQPDQHPSAYQRTADTHVSRTDPDASPMSASPGDYKLGYHTHYVVDGGKARIVLAALVTPASVMDNTPMLDLERWVRFRWHLKPSIAVGDARYGTVTNIVGLERDGLRAYLPLTGHGKPSGFYEPELFHYDAVEDCYYCPQGQQLSLHSRRRTEQMLVYHAKAAICNACPMKPHCTASRSGRHIFRSFFQEYVDRVRGYHATEAFKKAMRKRMVWVEPLFAEAKQWHQRMRFRLRGLRKVNIEGLLTATGQNIKRLLGRSVWDKPLAPSAAAAAAVRPLSSLFLFSLN